MPPEHTDTAESVRHLLVDALRNPTTVANRTPAEFDLTLRLLRRVRLLGRFAYELQQSGQLGSLPGVAADQLWSAMTLAEYRLRSARWELNRLAWALRDLTDVPLVAMKGCAYVLAGTPNSRGRTFADVDLMVPEQGLPAVEAQLKLSGWVSKQLSKYDDDYYRRWAHELPPMQHIEREVEVDLHHNILMRTARLHLSPVLLLERSRQVSGSRYRVLAPADMVLHAIVHLLYGGEMDDALRELVDIDELLRHFGEHEPGFWEGFWARAEQLGLARPAFYGLRYARQWLGTPVPESVIAASLAGAPPALAVRLMDRLVPRALFPDHPDSPSRATAVARLLLYVRSLWVRMPPLMLARHLTYKFYVRHVREQQKS